MDTSLLETGWSAQIDHLVTSAIEFWIERTIQIILFTHELSKVEHSSNSKSCWRNHGSFAEMSPYSEIRRGNTSLFHCCAHQFLSEFNGGHDEGNHNHL